jgi:hypothetical protein
MQLSTSCFHICSPVFITCSRPALDVLDMPFPGPLCMLEPGFLCGGRPSIRGPSPWRFMIALPLGSTGTGNDPCKAGYLHIKARDTSLQRCPQRPQPPGHSPGSRYRKNVSHNTHQESDFYPTIPLTTNKGHIVTIAHQRAHWPQKTLAGRWPGSCPQGGLRQAVSEDNEC